MAETAHSACGCGSIIGDLHVADCQHGRNRRHNGIKNSRPQGSIVHTAVRVVGNGNGNTVVQCNGAAELCSLFQRDRIRRSGDADLVAAIGIGRQSGVGVGRRDNSHTFARCKSVNGAKSSVLCPNGTLSLALVLPGDVGGIGLFLVGDQGIDQDRGHLLNGSPCGNDRGTVAQHGLYILPGLHFFLLRDCFLRLFFCLGGFCLGDSLFRLFGDSGFFLRFLGYGGLLHRFFRCCGLLRHCFRRSLRSVGKGGQGRALHDHQ